MENTDLSGETLDDIETRLDRLEHLHKVVLGSARGLHSQLKKMTSNMDEAHVSLQYLNALTFSCGNRTSCCISSKNFKNRPVYQLERSASLPHKQRHIRQSSSLGFPCQSTFLPRYSFSVACTALSGTAAAHGIAK